MEKIITWYPQMKQLHARDVKRQPKQEIKPQPQAFISTSLTRFLLDLGASATAKIRLRMLPLC